MQIERVEYILWWKGKIKSFIVQHIEKVSHLTSRSMCYLERNTSSVGNIRFGVEGFTTYPISYEPSALAGDVGGRVADSAH